MGIVTVAGGLGDLGRTIVQSIVSRGKHQVHILSRSARDHHIAPVVKISYESASEISDALQRLGVDTVVSVLNLHWIGAADAQINLIRGSAMSGTVKRFVPSEFNINYRSPTENMPYQPRNKFLQAEAELDRHPKLRYSLIRNGFFMDYLALPYLPTNLSSQLYCILDIPSQMMVIPGVGDQPVVFTHTTDVGTAVAYLLDVAADEWPREMSLVGDRMTLNELVALVESKWGKPFRVHHDSLETLRQNVTTELPSNKACYQLFPSGKEDLNSVICTQMIGMASGVFDIPGTNLPTFMKTLTFKTLDQLLGSCLLITCREDGLRNSIDDV